jgi:hypothetical protein
MAVPRPGPAAVWRLPVPVRGRPGARHGGVAARRHSPPSCRCDAIPGAPAPPPWRGQGGRARAAQ